MAPVIAAVVAAVGAISAAGAVASVSFFGIASGWAAVGLYAASSLVLSALSSALTPKIKSSSAGFSNFSVQASNRTLQIRQAITTRRIIYGETRVGGVLVYVASSDNEKYMHMVLVLAAHEVEAIDEIWVNDTVIPNDYIDEDGNVIDGRYANYMRIKKYLGGADQIADADLIAAVPEWTSAHRGRGHAYMYVRLEGNRDVYQTGVPSFSAVVRGKKVFDPRAAVVPEILWVQSASSDTGSIVLSPPGSVPDDAVLVGIIGTDYSASGDTDYGAPTGFESAIAYQRVNSGAAGLSGQVFYKVANSESGSYTFTETAHRKTHVVLLCVSGVDPAAIIGDIKAALVVSGKPVFPEIITPVENSLVVRAVLWDESKGLVEGAADLTQQAHVDQTGLDLLVYTNIQPDEGVSGEPYVDITSATRYIAFTLSLSPPTGLTVWSPNAALQSHDYLRDEKYGIGALEADVDIDTVIAAANACDEMVSVSAVTYQVSDVDADTDILTLGGDQLMLQRGDAVEIVSSGNLPAGLNAEQTYYVIPYQFAGTPRIQLAASFSGAILNEHVNLTTEGGHFNIRKISEPRYFGGGMLDTSVAVSDNLRDVMSSMGGTIVSIGGLWSMFAAVWRAPSIVLNEHHLRAPIEVQTRLPQRERFNGVKGVYVAPFHGWQPADYPSVVSSTYVSADNGRTVYRDLDLPFTQRPHTAQRLAKISLERSRREISLNYACDLRALQLQPADTVAIDNERFGWDEKAFEVLTHDLVMDGGGNGTPSLGVDMMLQEIDAAVFNWSISDEGGVTPASRTTLPNSYIVTVPIGVSLDSIPVPTQSGDRTYKIKITIDPHESSFVRNGGSLEVQFKESSSTVWRDYPPVDGGAIVIELFQAALGLFYDIRIRAVNMIGVPSAWVLVEGFSIGSSLLTDTEDWEHETLARDGTDLETDSGTSEDWEA